MSKQLDLEKLDQSIKEGEARLKNVQNNLEVLDKEIGSLSEVEAKLEENIKCLKKKNIVAMAAEFKKAKEDLAKTKARLSALKNDKDRFEKASEEVHKSMKKVKLDIEKLKNSSDNNVLQGKFRKKDNG